MTCPVCGGHTKVIDSRPYAESVYRRRECLECFHRFTTYEREGSVIKREIKRAIDTTLKAMREHMQTAFKLDDWRD